MSIAAAGLGNLLLRADLLEIPIFLEVVRSLSVLLILNAI